MAAGYICPPGHEYGPCAEECEHTDCIRTRNMAESACNICGEDIGYETRFYNYGKPGTDENLCHALCVEKRVR